MVKVSDKISERTIVSFNKEESPILGAAVNVIEVNNSDGTQVTRDSIGLAALCITDVEGDFTSDSIAWVILQELKRVRDLREEIDSDDTLTPEYLVGYLVFLFLNNDIPLAENGLNSAIPENVFESRVSKLKIDMLIGGDNPIKRANKMTQDFVEVYGFRQVSKDNVKEQFYMELENFGLEI